MNDADIFELIPAYALGALSEEERIQVEGLLARSPEARAELRSYAEMMVGMAALAPHKQAPAHLNADFKARLAKETRPAGVIVTPFRALLSIAAILVVVFGVYLAYQAIQANNIQREIDAIKSDPQATHVTLQPLNGSQGSVDIYTAPNHSKAAIVVDLPTLASNQQYQAWMIVNSDPLSMGAFTANGAGQFLMDIPSSLDQAFVYGLTVEPAGGSPKPTTNPIFAAEVKQTSALFPMLNLAW